MKKSLISGLLAVLMLLPLSLSSCTPESTAESSNPDTSSDPNYETTATEDTEPMHDLSDPAKDGRLWYYEDFESVELSENSSATASALGWSYDRTTDATLKPQTAKYQIVDHNGSRRLYIKNYDGDKKANDAFITLLSDRQMRYLQNKNYTYQYDITYADAESDSRYIVMISEYDGGSFYNSAHIRNGGYGNNENYSVEKWTSYDSSVSSKGNDSLSMKLLGKIPAKDVFKDISLSVRYVVNWETGNRVYIRVNTEGYPGSGKWTLVSEFKSGCSAADKLDPSLGGAALAIKTGGKQNGYIDNIIVWSGNGEEPEDKSSPLLYSKMKCHQLTEDGGKQLCVLCGKSAQELSDDWLLTELPRYEGGTLSEKLYMTGQGMDTELPVSKEGKMQIVSCTNGNAFLSYLAKLEADGWISEFSRDKDGNLYRSYTKGETRTYTYYIASTGEARIITEPLAVSMSADEFGYKYTPKAGESSAIYQYAIPMRDATHSWSEGYIDCGMIYVIKLADNSVIIIDGASASQFSIAQVNNFMSFLREITGVGANGKVKIAAWYLTHAHGDHFQGLALVLQRYNRSIELSRVIFNIPSAHEGDSVLSGLPNALKKMVNYINSLFGDVSFIKPHTGMTLQLADVTIETLYTHEDLVDPNSGITETGVNGNETSMVSRITFGGGKTFLLTGDIDGKAGAIMLENHNPEIFKSDVLQMAHHVLNDLSELYDLAKAPIVLIPQSLDRINEHSVSPIPYSTVLKYAKKEMCFFQNEYTVGIGVENGELKKIYTLDTVYKIKGSNW